MKAALLYILLSSSPSLAQVIENAGPCPDASADEAGGFTLMELDEPRQDELPTLMLVGADAHLNAHKVESFAAIAPAWSSMAAAVPQISNVIRPLSPLTDGDPLPPVNYAVCFTIAPGGIGFHYVPSVAVSSLQDVPEGLLAVIVPRGRYAVFPFNGNEDDTANFRYSANQYVLNSSMVRRAVPNIEVYRAGGIGLGKEFSMDFYIPIE